MALPPDHAAAVRLARAGEIEAAIEALNRLYARYPEESPEATPLRHDLAIVHTWDGNHAEAVRLIRPTPVDDQPTHVLAVYAESLHLTGELEEAVNAARQAMAR